MSELFNVVWFDPNGVYEYVGRNLEPLEAIERAKSYTERPAALIGGIARVIVTDAGDRTVFEWKHGIGITYPTPAEGLRPELYRADERKKAAKD